MENATGAQDALPTNKLLNSEGMYLEVSERQARSQDFVQERATEHFQLCEIFKPLFFPWNAHRRNFKVRQNSISPSANWIAHGDRP